MDPALRFALESSGVIFIILEEEFYNSDGVEMLTLAIELGKPILLIANQLGRTDPIPIEFTNYQGKKALVTESLGTPAAHAAMLSAMTSMGVDLATLGGTAWAFQYEDKNR